jgi:hypothetical protein
MLDPTGFTERTGGALGRGSRSVRDRAPGPTAWPDLEQPRRVLHDRNLECDSASVWAHWTYLY